MIEALATEMSQVLNYFADIIASWFQSCGVGDISKCEIYDDVNDNGFKLQLSTKYYIFFIYI